MTEPITFGSVCSGISAASVSWNEIGWKAAWFHEIESAPSAVLAHRFPDVVNHGDMMTAPARIMSGELTAPPVLCGGTPCQAFSVAGNREALDDARGNLSLTFCEIANAIDTKRAEQGRDPCVAFWENVPGVLSAKGNAFGCILAALAGEDDALVPTGKRWSNAGAVFGPKRTVAWRVVDAQYFGLAQRRRRVFVVASAREGFDPAAVLFEFEGVRRDTAPSRDQTQESTAALRNGVAYGGNNTAGHIDVATARNACNSASGRMDFESETFLVVPGNTQADDRVRRLTPVECERLQGFPDNHTAVPFRGKTMSDGPRYKTIGNSWAVNCTKWLGQRIDNAIKEIEVIHTPAQHQTDTAKLPGQVSNPITLADYVSRIDQATGDTLPAPALSPREALARLVIAADNYRRACRVAAIEPVVCGNHLTGAAVRLEESLKAARLSLAAGQSNEDRRGQ